jgi:hypothetical protein
MSTNVSISRTALANLHRAATRGNAVAAKATAPKPKASAPSPRRAEKLKLLAKAPHIKGDMRAHILAPSMTVATARAIIKSLDPKVAVTPPHPHLQRAPDGSWMLTPKAAERMRMDAKMGRVNLASAQVHDAHGLRFHHAVHRYELDLAEANGATITCRKAIGVQH